MLAYGSKRFSPARFMPTIEYSANSMTPVARAEAMKSCYKAIYKCLGEAAVSPYIVNLKEAQKVQLEKDFEQIKAENKNFKRKTRIEQMRAKQLAKDIAIAATEEEEKKDEAIEVEEEKEALA